MGYITLSSIVATISVLPATLAVYSYSRHHRLLAYVFAHAAIAGFAVAVAASPPLAPHTTGVLGKVSSTASIVNVLSVLWYGLHPRCDQRMLC